MYKPTHLLLVACLYASSILSASGQNHSTAYHRSSGEGFAYSQTHSAKPDLFTIVSSVTGKQEFQIDVSYCDASNCLVTKVSQNSEKLSFELVDPNEMPLDSWNFEQHFFAFHHPLSEVDSDMVYLKVKNGKGQELCSFTVKRIKL